MSQSSTKGSICWKYIPWYHIVASSKWSNFVVNWYFLVFPTKKSGVQILSFIVVIIDLKTIYIYIYIYKQELLLILKLSTYCIFFNTFPSKSTGRFIFMEGLSLKFLVPIFWMGNKFYNMDSWESTKKINFKAIKKFNN